jgi:co-chaperonin GroES (HSP10)
MAKGKLRKEIAGVLPEMPFNKILVTADKFDRESSIILTTDADTYETIQKVVKAGPGATYGGNPPTQVKEGDIIDINTFNFKKRKTSNSIKQDMDVTKEYHEVELPIVEFAGKEYMIITDRDILHYWRLKETK